MFHGRIWLCPLHIKFNCIAKHYGQSNCACFLTLDLKCCRAHLAIRRRPGPGLSWGQPWHLSRSRSRSPGWSRPWPRPRSLRLGPVFLHPSSCQLYSESLCKSFNTPQGMRSWSWMLQCDFLLTCLCVRDCRWYWPGDYSGHQTDSGLLVWV